MSYKSLLARGSQQEHATGGRLSRILDPRPISDPGNFPLPS